MGTASPASNTILELARAGQLGPDVEFIHCTGLSEDAWQAIAANGVKLSLAVPIEMAMRHGMPPIVEALAHGIRPSLSSDVDTNLSQSPFTQMRAAFTLQPRNADAGVVDLELVLHLADAAHTLHGRKQIRQLRPENRAAQKHASVVDRRLDGARMRHDSAQCGSHTLLDDLIARGVTAQVGLGNGSNYSGGRRMQAGATGNYLNYELYSNAGRTTVWDNASNRVAYTAASKAAQTLTIYGRVAGGQDAAAGSYTDTVVAQAEW